MRRQYVRRNVVVPHRRRLGLRVLLGKVSREGPQVSVPAPEEYSKYHMYSFVRSKGGGGGSRTPSEL